MSLEGQLEMFRGQWQAENGEILDFNILIDAMPKDVQSIDPETSYLKLVATKDVATLYHFTDENHVEQINYRGGITKFERCASQVLFEIKS